MKTSGLAVIHYLNKEGKCLEFSVDVICELPEAQKELDECTHTKPFALESMPPCSVQSTFLLHSPAILNCFFHLTLSWDRQISRLL